MTALAPHLSAFLREHLPRERNASRHTGAAYACTYKLLLCFAADRLTLRPAQIEIEHLDTTTVLAFLDHIEEGRANTARSRNARLAAIKAFFRYLEFRLAACLDQARQIHAIPMKKFDEALIDFLTPIELQAVLDAPNARNVYGRRDAAMLHLAFASGLRVSELVGLRLSQLDQRAPVSVHVVGKGRRERVLPLWKETWDALRAWLHVRSTDGDAELFLNARGRAMSRFGFAHVLAKHVAVASKTVPALSSKQVTPHVLRHTCAMHMLKATGDVRKVSLWLGHASLQSTEIYLRCDPGEKLETIEAATPPQLRKGRFRDAPDQVLAMLNAVASGK
jgi:site-specific recombinase XerD